VKAAICRNLTALLRQIPPKRGIMLCDRRRLPVRTESLVS
jgi:hypothetical protein